MQHKWKHSVLRKVPVSSFFARELDFSVPVEMTSFHTVKALEGHKKSSMELTVI